MSSALWRGESGAEISQGHHLEYERAREREKEREKLSSTSARNANVSDSKYRVLSLSIVLIMIFGLGLVWAASHRCTQLLQLWPLWPNPGVDGEQ